MGFVGDVGKALVERYLGGASRCRKENQCEGTHGS
jgi:hypothetical protein